MTILGISSGIEDSFSLRLIDVIRENRRKIESKNGENAIHAFYLITSNLRVPRVLTVEQ